MEQFVPLCGSADHGSLDPAAGAVARGQPGLSLTAETT